MRFHPLPTVVWLSLQTAACGLESSGPAAPAGGNPPPAVQGGIASGSRLQVEYFTSADGARLPTGNLWDSQRTERCAFGPDANGALRCLPFPGALATTFYADAGCTMPLFPVDPAAAGCAPTYGYFIGTGGTCGERRNVFYKLGAPTGQRPAAAYTRWSNGACQATGAPTGVMLSYSLVQPAEFVTATTGAAP